MHLRFPSMLLVAGLAGSVAGCASTDDPEGSAAVDEVLAELGEGGFSGLVVLESAGEQQIAGYGRADREADLAHGPDTVYDVGSITKQFTGAAILKLQEAGVVSVDDTAGRHLRTLSGPAAEATIHQLLTHTAGLPDSLGPDDDYVDKDTYLQMVADAPQVAPPGTMHSYSNVGYSVLAAIIEGSTDMSYEEYLRTELFETVGMDDTGYVLPDWDHDAIATGYVGDDAVGRPNDANWTAAGPSWHLMGNGGLLSTPKDMMSWHRALLGTDLLTEESKQLYFGRHVPEDDSGQSYYGYGWAIFPRDAGGDLITHDGGNGVFFADFLRFVDDDLVVLLFSNADDTVPRDAARKVAAAALGEEAQLAVACGTDDLGEFDLRPDVPSTDVGALATTLFELFADPSPSDVSRFLEERVAMSVRQGLSDRELLATFRSIADELGSLTIGAVAEDGDDTLHSELRDESGRLVAIVTTVIDDGDPPILTCFEVSVVAQGM